MKTCNITGKRQVYSKNGAHRPVEFREDQVTVDVLLGADGEGINTGGRDQARNIPTGHWKPGCRLGAAECDSTERTKLSTDACGSGVETSVFNNLHQFVYLRKEK